MKNNKKFYKIGLNDKDYLILKENVVDDVKNIIQEKELYVRTPLTLYENSENSKILSLIKKGQKVDIIGYDKIDEKGNKLKLKSMNI